MSTTTTVECTIVRVTRKQNSVSGNPTKVLHTNQGVFVTAKDADVAYGISDLWEDKPARLTLDNRGRVIDLETVLPCDWRGDYPDSDHICDTDKCCECGGDHCCGHSKCPANAP